MANAASHETLHSVRASRPQQGSRTKAKASPHADCKGTQMNLLKRPVFCVQGQTSPVQQRDHLGCAHIRATGARAAASVRWLVRTWITQHAAGKGLRLRRFCVPGGAAAAAAGTQVGGGLCVAPRGASRVCRRLKIYRPSLTEVCVRVYRTIGCVGLCAPSSGNLPHARSVLFC